MREALAEATDLVEKPDPYLPKASARALVAAARVFLLGDRIRIAVRCLASADATRNVVREVVDRWVQRHATGDTERDARFWLEPQLDAPCPPPVMLATLSTLLAARGRNDVGALLAAEAITSARAAGRDEVFLALYSMDGAMPAADAADTLQRTIQGVIEVEGWWAIVG